MTRILTSHVGSLPRSQEVVDFIFARENNENYDETSFVLPFILGHTLDCFMRRAIHEIPKGSKLHLGQSENVKEAIKTPQKVA